MSFWDAWEREIVPSVLYLGHIARVDKLMRAVVGHHMFVREQGGYSIVKLAVHMVQKYRIDGVLAGSIESGMGLPEATTKKNQLKASQAIKLIERLK